MAGAADMLRRGEVIAIPTDTFYGLAANPFDRYAIDKVFAIKGRSKASPLLLLVNSLAMAAELSSNPLPLFYSLAGRFWPGPLTIVVDASPKLPSAVTAGTGRIGLRLPAAPIPVALIEAAGIPITATSANLTGQKECRTALEVESALGERLPLIVDGGASDASMASTVLGLEGTTWKMIWEGSISRIEIETFLSGALAGEKRT